MSSLHLSIEGEWTSLALTWMLGLIWLLWGLGRKLSEGISLLEWSQGLIMMVILALESYTVRAGKAVRGQAPCPSPVLPRSQLNHPQDSEKSMWWSQPEPSGTLILVWPGLCSEHPAATTPGGCPGEILPKDAHSAKATGRWVPAV